MADGHTVLGVDNFDDYYARKWKRDHLRRLSKEARFKFLDADLLEVDLDRILKPGTRLFHLAAQPGVRGSWGSRFDRYVRNNVQVTQRLLEAASRRRVGRFVYASSSSIYGNPESPPTTEDTLPQPVSPYGVTKLCGEHLCAVYRKARGLQTVSLRFFTVYGPGQRPDMAFHLFFDAVTAGRPVSINGRGDQIRDFTFVDDIVDGIVAAGARETRSSVFNLGGGSPTKLATALRLVEKVSGRSARIRHVPAAEGDPRITWADTGRARKELGFMPKVTLAEGLARQWEWQRARIASARG